MSAVDSNSVEVAGLTFDLPTHWEVVSVEESAARISIPDEQYEVFLPLEVEQLSETQQAKIADGNMGEFLEETPTGAKVYDEVCAPTSGCAYILYRERAYQVTFLVPEGNEPPPADLDGPWFPNADVTRDEISEVFSSVR